MIPTEVHIKLVVHEAQAAAGLRVAAINVLNAAKRSVDSDAIGYFYRAYYCVRAVEAAYARMQAFSLDNEIDAVHALPDLCFDWCSLIGDLQWPISGEEASFPGLSALCADNVIGDLVKQPGEQCYVNEEGTLRFLLMRDGEREGASAVDALMPSRRLGSRFASFWRRLQLGDEGDSGAATAAGGDLTAVQPGVLSANGCA